jgi:hypothetical protein
MRSLTGPKRGAIGVAINEFLRYLGPDVVRTDFGKSLGEGLYEFRVDQDAEQILRKAGKDQSRSPNSKESCCGSSSTRTGTSSSSSFRVTTRPSTRASPTRTPRLRKPVAFKALEGKPKPVSPAGARRRTPAKSLPRAKRGLSGA